MVGAKNFSPVVVGARHASPIIAEGLWIVLRISESSVLLIALPRTHSAIGFCVGLGMIALL